MTHVIAAIRLFTPTPIRYRAKTWFRPYILHTILHTIQIANTYDGLGRYISWFKRMTTNEYIRNVKNKNWQPFNKRIWQRNYYEHIIRTEQSLNEIREYIINNPQNWEKDELFK